MLLRTYALLLLAMPLSLRLAMGSPPNPTQPNLAPPRIEFSIGVQPSSIMATRVGELLPRELSSYLGVKTERLFIPEVTKNNQINGLLVSRSEQHHGNILEEIGISTTKKVETLILQRKLALIDRSAHKGSWMSLRELETLLMNRSHDVIVQSDDPAIEVFLRQSRLLPKVKVPSGRDGAGKQMKLVSSADVLASVETGAVGFGLMYLSPMVEEKAAQKRIRILAISEGNAAAAVDPRSLLFQKNYLLAESVYLATTDDLTGALLTEFCSSSRFAQLFENDGSILTIAKHDAYRAAKRLEEYKAGRGVSIRGLNWTQEKKLIAEAELAFTKSEGPIHFRTEASMDSKEVLVSDRIISESESARLGDFNTTPFSIAARGCAIIVPSKNSLKSLSMTQIQGMFAGESTNWTEVGAKSGRINIYTEPATSSTHQIFAKEVLPREKQRGMAYRKDTADVVAAVSMDENGIGLVNLANFDVRVQNVKIVAIGPAMKPIAPTPENIRTGNYPLAQRLFVYVHPKASDTAKDFAKFLLSPECSETYRKNGLIPLSEEAVAAEIKAAALEEARAKARAATQPAKKK